MLVGISNHLWQSTLFTAGFLAADSCIAEGPGGGAVAALAPRLPEIPGSLFAVRQLGQFAWISALLPRRRWRRCHWPWIRSANRSPRQSHRSRCRPQSGPRMGFSSAVCDLAVRLPRSAIAWLQWWQAWSFNPGKDRCQRLSLRASRDQLKISPQISPVAGSATRKAPPIGFRIVVHEREK